MAGRWELAGRVCAPRTLLVVATIALPLWLAGCNLGAGADASGMATEGGAEEGGIRGDSSIDARSEATRPETGVDTGTDAATTETGAHSTGNAIISVSSQPFDFGAVACGATKTTRTLDITNSGSAPLAISATTTGSAFAVSPPTLNVAVGATSQLTISVTVSSFAVAGTALTGSLNLFTNDARNTRPMIHLSVTPSGPAIALQGVVVQGSTTTLNFPGTEVGHATNPQSFILVNQGNAAATVMVGPPGDTHFALSGVPAGGVSLAPGTSQQVNVVFTPTDTKVISSGSSLNVQGTTCAQTLPQKIAYVAQGTRGTLEGWPASGSIDFGLADCGGTPPHGKIVTLKNTGTVDVAITKVDVSNANGFVTSAQVNEVIQADAPGAPALPVAITFQPPPVPRPSSLDPIQGTITIFTDGDLAAGGTSIHMSEQPRGGILAFSPAPAGTFDPIVLLQSESQTFGIQNTGNAVTPVTVSTASNDAMDAGDAGTPAAIGDAMADGTVSPPPQAFSVFDPALMVPNGGTASDTLTFAPLAAGGTTGTLAIATIAPICQPLPSPVILSGSGIGGGLTASRSSLTFASQCGGQAPAAQAVMVTNNGNRDVVWSLGNVTGAGAAQYKVFASKDGGTLGGTLSPGQSDSFSVGAAAIPSPAPNVDPAAYAAQLTIQSNVPGDYGHVVALNEPPLGDQLRFSGVRLDSLGRLLFGEVPINTPLAQAFAVANLANPGSPPATVTLLKTGTGAAAYSIAVPPELVSLGPGETSSSSEVTFTATAPVAYDASIALTTTDSLCTSLPPPILLNATGTSGVAAVSPTTLAFGADGDPKGFVNCGHTGQARTVSVTNGGNQPFHITAIGLRTGAYQIATQGTVLPAVSGIPFALNPPITVGGDPVTMTITPNPIPAMVQDPTDATAFTDALTISTDITGDTSHTVSLVMQARGAVIEGTPPLPIWNFGTVSFGSIATFTSGGIKNTGNLPAAIALTGLLSQPPVFGLASGSMAVGPAGLTSIVGQFAPTHANGSWSESGTLSVTADAFCAPLPAQWTNAMIALSGTSNGSSAVTAAGDLAFPTTDCGGTPPAGRPITLSNNTNVPYAYSAKLGAGKYYSLGNGNGTLPAGGTIAIVVSPNAILAGPGVVSGAATYADDLLISLSGLADAGAPSILMSPIPISWYLNGAVLSLPLGAGPKTDAQGNAFYPADSMSGFTLPMDNTGTSTATVGFTVGTPSLLSFSPMPPIQVIPGIRAAPELIGANVTACPTTTDTTIRFVYSVPGPVCQPFQVPASSGTAGGAGNGAVINVHVCGGVQ